MLFVILFTLKKLLLDIILKDNGGGKQNRTAAFRMQIGYAPTRLYPQTIVGNIGFEPMTLRLSIGCSTTEPIAHTIKKMKKKDASL